jgi:hypothetical protein
VSAVERKVYFQIAKALGVPEPEADFLIDTVEASRLALAELASRSASEAEEMPAFKPQRSS